MKSGNNDQLKPQGDASKKPKLRLSYSSRGTFVNCRQAYYYYKIKGIKVRDSWKSNALKAGSVWDDFIGHVYTGKPFAAKFHEEFVPQYELSDIDIVKLESMFKSYKKLGIKHEQGGRVQHEFEINTKNCVLNGKIDVGYTDHFEEHKFSGSPQWYTVPFNIHGQLSTYFAANNNFKVCRMMVAKFPQLRLKRDEGIDQFATRLEAHILSHPSEYFIGFDRLTKRYGMNFYRDEFERYNDLIHEYEMIADDINGATKNGHWYQNKTSCYKFGEPNACQYVDICECGKVNPEKYIIRGEK